MKETSDEDLEIKKEIQVHLLAHSGAKLNSMIQRYSSWYKLKRGFAWLIRFEGFIENKLYSHRELSNPSDGRQPPLSLEDLRTAEVQIIKYVQRESFPQIIDAQKRSGPLKQQKHESRGLGSCGSIYKLRPWLNQSGILRVGGRLENAPIDYQAKHQIFLPSNLHVSSLIIMEHHELVGHFGQEYVLASLRQRYWIAKHASVRRVIGRCLTCRRENALRGQQLMASLPKDRLTPVLWMSFLMLNNASNSH